MDNKELNNMTVVQYYTNLIQEAKDREKDWRKLGRDLVSLYECEEDAKAPFNILYANTEIMAPAIYNRLPTVVVKRRFEDADPLGKVAAEVAQRTIQYLIENDDPSYTTVDELIKSSVFEALVPGRGIVKVKYDAEYKEVEEGEAEDVSYETVCLEEVPWDRFICGYAKKWADTPWIAFERFMTEEELEKLLGEEKKYLLDLIPFNASSEALKAEKDAFSETSQTSVKLTHIYEIWDKEEKKIVFICPDYEEVILESEDIFKLKGFYPVPKPLKFFNRISGQMPQSLYKSYKSQAEELNRVTVRINKIIEALKVRGFYDSSIENLAELMSSEDNTLIAAQNVNKLEGKSLDNVIWLMPLNELVGVLQQLYIQRGQIKDIIYEIIGMSDIIRGSSVASETASAQQLKSQWGSMRLKTLQKEVARYSRDILRLLGELGLTKLSQKTIAGMTGVDLPTEEEKTLLARQLQELQTASIPQAPMTEGQPPAEPDPQIQAQMQQIQDRLSKFSWEQVLGVLQDDLQRNYKIAVETNSTIEVEASEDKQQVSEFMNAFAQFMNGVAPLVETGMMSFDVAKAMMMAIVRKYRFGGEVEEQLDQMQAPPPKEEKPDPKQQAEAQKIQMEMQAADQQDKMKAEQAQIDLQIKQQDLQMKQQDSMQKGRELQRSELLAQREYLS